MHTVHIDSRHRLSQSLSRQHSAAGTIQPNRAAVVTQALPKRRRQPRKKPKSEPKEFSDDELIRELNSSHLWLPDVDSDFGLDDVAAHVASRNQAQVVDVSSSNSSSSSKGKVRRGSADAVSDPQALSDIDLTSGQPMPEWIQEMKQAGFDVMSRDGQLFLQRGTVTPQQQQKQQQKPQQQAPPAIQQPQQQQQQQQRTAEEAVAQSVFEISDRSLSVHAEFDPAVWQDHTHKLQRGSNSSSDADADTAAGGAAGAWYASPPTGSSSTSSSVSSTDAESAAETAASSASSMEETLSFSPSRSSSRRSSMTATSIQRTLLSFKHPNQLMALLQAVFPAWSANGYWLVSQTGPGVVAAPSPAEAAAALKGLALAARRARLNAVQLQSLSREPLVAGLVESLRLTPPRSAPHQPTDLSRRLWSIAKAYWMQAGATTAAAAQQQLLAGALAAQGVRGGQALLGAAGGQGGPALGPLLAQLQAKGGGALSKQQLAAAQALVASRGEDQLRRTAVVSALWGMASIGGALFFQQEMDALCRIAQAKFSRWSPHPSELSNVLWALAHARHWTPLIPQLETSIMAAGGAPACTAAEVVTSIWAFAVLGHTPKQLLQQLDTKGWCVKGDRSQPQQQQQQQQQTPAAASSSSSSSSGIDRLAELRDSQLCTLAWSLACCQLIGEGLFKAVWVEVCRRGPSLAADTRQAVQLAQAALAIQLEGRYRPDALLPGEGTSQLLAAASGVFAQQNAALQAQKAHSSYQRSIAGTLSRLRVMHVMEDTSTGYAVDITIPSMRLAVEADGPSHFSRSPHPSGALMQLGATAMKRRHLQQLGWAVVNVPYSDWDRQIDEQQKVAYLKQRIAEAKRDAGARAAAAADDSSSGSS